MAKKKIENKIVLERTYNVPLRKAFLKVPRQKRSKKAITALREFLVKHMKSNDVRIGRHANMKVWQNGIRNPPHHIEIVAKKDETGKVTAEIVGAPVEVVIEKEEKKKPTDKKEPVKKIEKEIKKLEEKTEKIKEEKAETAAVVQEEEIKELKKEHPKTHPEKVAKVEKKVAPKTVAPKGKSEISKP